MSARDITVGRSSSPEPSRSGGQVVGKLFWPILAVANFAFFAALGWPILVAAGLIATATAWALAVQPKPAGMISDATRELDSAMISVAGEDLATVCTEPDAELAAGCIKRHGRIIVMANSAFVSGLDGTQLRGVAAVIHGQARALTDKRLMRVLFAASFSACLIALVGSILVIGPAPGETAIGPLAIFVALWPIFLPLSRSAGSACLYLPIYRRQMATGDRIAAELSDRESVLSGLGAMRDWQARHDRERPLKRRVAQRIMSPLPIQLHLDARIATLSSTSETTSD
jgi:hypothetical protein